MGSGPNRHVASKTRNPAERTARGRRASGSGPVQALFNPWGASAPPSPSSVWRKSRGQPTSSIPRRSSIGPQRWPDGAATRPWPEGPSATDRYTGRAPACGQQGPSARDWAAEAPIASTRDAYSGDPPSGSAVSGRAAWPIPERSAQQSPPPGKRDEPAAQGPSTRTGPSHGHGRSRHRHGHRKVARGMAAPRSGREVVDQPADRTGGSTTPRPRPPNGGAYSAALLMSRRSAAVAAAVSRLSAGGAVEAPGEEPWLACNSALRRACSR